MRRKIPLLLLCLLFLGIAIYAGSQFWRQWKEYNAGEEIYDTLSQHIQLAEPPPISTEQTGLPGQSSETAESTADPQLAGTIPIDGTLCPVVDFEMLQQTNPDVVAWIYPEGTEINYPVVQGDDNSEYLHRLVDGTYNGAGSIFLDYRNGEAYDTVTLSASNSWKYTWEDLTDEFEWKVDEPSVPSGYNKTVRVYNTYSYYITNTYEDIPKTGDNSDLLGLGLMGMVGIIGFCFTAFLLFVTRKKGKYEG